MRIKICGITRQSDALEAIRHGAWAIGYIFYEKSQRYISPVEAGMISGLLSCERVGVFVNSSVLEIVDIAEKACLSMIQLHGGENKEFVEALRNQINLPIIKATRVAHQKDLLRAKDLESCVDYLLFDTYSENAYGGTGESFEWELMNEQVFSVPIILSGGINSSNVKKAASTNCFALDISSGVEVSKGIKDPQKIEEVFSLASLF